MKRLIVVTALLAAYALPALASDKESAGSTDRPAHARDGHSERFACSTMPAAEWMPIEQMAAMLTKQGFTVVRIESKSGCHEAKVTDAEGTALELHLDAVTAEIVRRRERS